MCVHRFNYPHYPQIYAQRRDRRCAEILLRDAHGQPIAPSWLHEPVGANNWLRRILYFFNAPRRWTRSV